jgi:hypothetical protein
MVSSIQGYGSIQAASMGGMRPQGTSLTDDQKQTIADILSEYDPENITEEDAQEIFQKFKDAGITPARGMKEAIEAAGFDAEDLRAKGMPEGQQPPPPPPPDKTRGSGSVNLNALQSLQSILSEYDLSSISEDEQSELLTRLNQAGLMQTGYTIDLSA